MKQKEMTQKTPPKKNTDFIFSAPRSWAGHPTHLNLMVLEETEPERMLLDFAEKQKNLHPEQFRSLCGGRSPAGLYIRVPYQAPPEEDRILRLVADRVNNKTETGLRASFQYRGILFLDMTQWAGRCKENPHLKNLIKMIFDLGSYWNATLILTGDQSQRRVEELCREIAPILPCRVIPPPNRQAARVNTFLKMLREQGFSCTDEAASLILDTAAHAKELDGKRDDSLWENAAVDIALFTRAQGGEKKIDRRWAEEYLKWSGSCLCLLAGGTLLRQEEKSHDAK